MSNPATYTGAFDAIREVFAKLPLSKMRGYTANRFSFNRPGGRCEACEGMGQRCIEMHFLPDVWIDCENCKGARYVPETLEVAFRGKSIADVLSMRISEAAELFDSIPKVRRILRTLNDVGLGYLQLGQSAPTLSGGEAQRVKLAAELGKPSTGKTLYILDEPTTGLHFDDLRKLLGVLHRLVDLGNTVICIEHNLDVIKTADWVLDLGPEAGEAGGQIVVAGPPELIAATPQSYTGRALKPVLDLGPVAERPVFDAKKAAQADLSKDKAIDLGEQVKMPWEVDGERWHTVDHLDHNGEPVAWEPALLTWLVDSVHKAAGAGQADQNRDRKGAVGRSDEATKRRGDEREKSKSRKVKKSKTGFAPTSPPPRGGLRGGGEARSQDGDGSSGGATPCFAPTDWNHRSRVEITAGKNEQWFCHILTGNKDLLEVAIRVPRRTFTEPKLLSLLKIKTLDERKDLPIYGQWERVRIRSLKGIAGDWADIRLSLRDMKDVDDRGFASFLQKAVEAYFQHIRKHAEAPELTEPWKVDGQQWHLSHKGMSARQKPKWSSALLLAVIGRLKSLDPELTFDWSSSKTGVNIFAADGARRGKIVTNMGRGLRVCLLVPAGVFTPAQVDRLGEDVEIKPCRENDWITFWLKSLSDNDSGQLREAWERATEGPEPEQELMFA